MNSYMRQVSMPMEQIHSFLKDKRAWENAINIYKGPDPLDHWYNYICWYENHLHGDTPSEYRKTLERCLKIFEDAVYYYNDARMVRLWLKYIAMLADNVKENYYRVLHHRGLGKQIASFYVSWANFYESLNQIREAEETYQLAIQLGAEPSIEVQNAHHKFLYKCSMLQSQQMRKQQFMQQPQSPHEQQQVPQHNHFDHHHHSLQHQHPHQHQHQHQPQPPNHQHTHHTQHPPQHFAGQQQRTQHPHSHTQTQTHASLGQHQQNNQPIVYQQHDYQQSGHHQQHGNHLTRTAEPMHQPHFQQQQYAYQALYPSQEPLHQHTHTHPHQHPQQQQQHQQHHPHPHPHAHPQHQHHPIPSQSQSQSQPQPLPHSVQHPHMPAQQVQHASPMYGQLPHHTYEPTSQHMVFQAQGVYTKTQQAASTANYSSQEVTTVKVTVSVDQNITATAPPSQCKVQPGLTADAVREPEAAIVKDQLSAPVDTSLIPPFKYPSKRFCRYSKNHDEIFETALFLEEPADPSRVCHYDKKRVYPDGAGIEFSPEELRAAKYLDRFKVVQPQSPAQPPVQCQVQPSKLLQSVSRGKTLDQTHCQYQQPSGELQQQPYPPTTSNRQLTHLESGRTFEAAYANHHPQDQLNIYRSASARGSEVSAVTADLEDGEDDVGADGADEADDDGEEDGEGDDDDGNGDADADADADEDDEEERDQQVHNGNGNDNDNDEEYDYRFAMHTLQQHDTTTTIVSNMEKQMSVSDMRIGEQQQHQHHRHHHHHHHHHNHHQYQQHQQAQEQPQQHYHQHQQVQQQQQQQQYQAGGEEGFKSLKIKFKKKRHHGEGTSNESTYTIESVSQSESQGDESAQAELQTPARRNDFSFHPYKSSTPKSVAKRGKSKIKKADRPPIPASACSSSNSSSVENGFAASNGNGNASATGNANGNELVNGLGKGKLHCAMDSTITNATFNDNANHSFLSAAVQESSECTSISHATYREAIVAATTTAAVEVSTYQENSYFATQHDVEAKERRLQKAYETIRSHMAQTHVDPFNSELCRAFLTKIGFPGNDSNEVNANYKVIDMPLPKINNARNINIPDVVNYSIDKDVGRGSYGWVYKATDTASGEVVAVKFQKPANTWEIYICDQVLKRLQESNVLPGIMTISKAIIAPNASLIATEFSQFGSLLDVNNKVRTATRKPMPELLVMLFSAQICDIVHHLHRTEIIHADIKPDNFLLMRIPTLCGYPSVRLIDFGCAIDMKLFPNETRFHKEIQTDGFTCIEMQEGRSWTYETDYFCVAATIYVLLIGSYMQVQKRTGIWDTKSKLPRYLRRDIWTTFYNDMLNLRANNLPDLQHMRDMFRAEVNKGESELQGQIRMLSNTLHRR